MQRLTSHILRPIRSGTAIITIMALLFASIAHTSRAEAPQQGDLLKSTADSSMIVDGFTQEQRAEKIDAFFRQWDLPMAGEGLKLVKAADEYGVDWRLVASIGFIESTGGKFKCRKAPNNYWGWHSCKSGFETMDIAIVEMTKHLGGHKSGTANYYAGKTIPQILDAYNPPTIRHNYKSLVMGTMAKITAMPVTETTQLAVNK